MEHCGCDQTLQEPHSGGEEIIEAPSANLKEDEEDEGCGERNKGRQPDGNDLLSDWIGILRVDDIPVWMENRKGSVRCGSY